MNQPTTLPPEVQQTIKQALNATKQQQWDKALEIIKPYIDQAHLCIEGCVVMGYICIHQNKLNTAAQYFSQALQYDSSHPVILFQLGEVLRFSNKPYNAIQYFNHLIKIDPTHVGALVSLGRTLYSIDKIEAAINCFNQAAVLDKEHKDVNTLLANCYDSLGDEENAEKYFKLAQESDPNNCALLFSYTSNRKGKIKESVEQRIQELYQQTDDMSARDKSYIYYALGLVNEKKKDLPKAFEFYQKANDTQLEKNGYSGDDIWYLDNIKNQFTDELIEKLEGAGNPSNQPIFIVGMPRSGTTLTGQILASHSEVEMAGELNIVNMMSQTTIPQLIGGSYDKQANQLLPEHCETLGGLYLQMMAMHSTAPHVIDKMPSNMIHIGLIRSILPNAKIIYCERDPVDICWSIWRQYFTKHHYRHRLEDLAEMYAKAIELMNYWMEKFPDDIHVSNYESLIADPETNSRKLIDFCELDWEDACLNFHKTKTTVRTASIQQVRQPLYNSSLKSWEPVREQLQPLIDALRKHGIPVEGSLS